MYCNHRSTCDCVDFIATYEATATTVLSANPADIVPLLSINGWILMQRKRVGSVESFNKTWNEYRDGFGSPTGNDNYWLGLDKIYRLMQMGRVRLRIEVYTLCFKKRGVELFAITSSVVNHFENLSLLETEMKCLFIHK